MFACNSFLLLMKSRWLKIRLDTVNPIEFVWLLFRFTSFCRGNCLVQFRGTCQTICFSKLYTSIFYSPQSNFRCSPSTILTLQISREGLRSLQTSILQPLKRKDCTVNPYLRRVLAPSKIHWHFQRRNRSLSIRRHVFPLFSLSA